MNRRLREPEHARNELAEEIFFDDLAEELELGALAEGRPQPLELLHPDDFAHAGRAAIFEIVVDHAALGRPLELAAISGALADRGRRDLDYELALCSDQFTDVDAPYLAYYAARLKMLAAMRGLQRTLASAWAAMRDPRLDVDERLDQVAVTVPLALAKAQGAMAKFREGGHGGP